MIIRTTVPKPRHFQNYLAYAKVINVRVSGVRKQGNHVAKRKIYKNIIQTSIRTYERIAITYHGVRFPDHLVRHPEVEIESRLILAEPEQLEGDGDSLGLAVVNRGPPGRTAPEAAHVRSLGLRNLERTVRTPLSSERHKFPQGEAVERQLKSQVVSTLIEIVGRWMKFEQIY